MSFPRNEWIILLTCVQEPVYIGVQMKVPLPMPLLSFQGSSACGGVTSSPAVAGGKHPLPVPAFGGPGAPPATAGEVAQTFRSHSEETSAKAERGSCATTSI